MSGGSPDAGTAGAEGDVDGLLSLTDWRRRVAELYARVRDEADPQQAWRMWVATREDLYLRHPQSPLPPDRRDATDAPRHFEHDPRLRVTAVLEAAEPVRVTLPSSGGSGLEAVRSAQACATLLGEPIRLDVHRLLDYAGGLLVMFRDATSGAETYAAGRYLLDTAKGADLGVDGEGRLVLDFNFAYQPSCSHDPRWSCPLPTPGNRLPMAVRGGERLARGG